MSRNAPISGWNFIPNCSINIGKLNKASVPREKATIIWKINNAVSTLFHVFLSFIIQNVEWLMGVITDAKLRWAFYFRLHISQEDEYISLMSFFHCANG